MPTGELTTYTGKDVIKKDVLSLVEILTAIDKNVFLGGLKSLLIKGTTGTLTKQQV